VRRDEGVTVRTGGGRADPTSAIEAAGSGSLLAIVNVEFLIPAVVGENVTATVRLPDGSNANAGASTV